VEADGFAERVMRMLVLGIFVWHVSHYGGTSCGVEWKARHR